MRGGCDAAAGTARAARRDGGKAARQGVAFARDQLKFYFAWNKFKAALAESL